MRSAFGVEHGISKADWQHRSGPAAQPGWNPSTPLNNPVHNPAPAPSTLRTRKTTWTAPTRATKVAAAGEQGARLGGRLARLARGRTGVGIGAAALAGGGGVLAGRRRQ